MKYDDFLQSLVNDVEDIMTEARTTFFTLDENQFNWKANSKSWSIAQCLDHIRVAGIAYLPEFEVKLASFSDNNDVELNKEFRSGFFAKGAIYLAGPNSSLKVRTSSNLEPKLSNYTSDSFEDFVEFHKTFASVINKARMVNPHMVKIQSPVASLFKLGIADMLKFIIGHEQRHMNQAREVMARPNFPS